MPDNVLLVTIDSLRYDRVFNSDRDIEPAPNLVELATDGFSCTNAYANGPSTPSSFPTILTSTYSPMYGGYRYLDDRRPFLSETFRSDGYRTVGYHSNPHLGPEKNYNHGFDTFNDGAEADDDARTIKNVVDEYVPADSRLYSFLRRIWHYYTMTTNASAYTSATEITDQAMDWLDESWDGETPYFMWLHYMDVHYPFTPPDRFLEELGIEPLSTRRTTELNGLMQENPEDLTEADRQDLLNLYDAEIRFMDHNLGRLLDRLTDRGAREDTTVVVTADHGEAFGEHDRYGHHPYQYDELLHVPLVFDVPDVDGRTVDQQVSLIDIGPTVLDLCDLPVPDNMQGRSLTPLFDGERRDEELTFCTSKRGEMMAVRTPEWKFLWDLDDDTIELYDLQTDPGETTEMSDGNPETVNEYRDLIGDYLEKFEQTNTELPEVSESDEVKQRLEDLGYVD